MDVRVEGQVVDAPEQGDVAAVLQKALSGKNSNPWWLRA